MPLDELAVLSNVATMFTPDSAVDEAAFAAHLDRMVDAQVGIFLNSPGSGEVHSLSRHEFQRLCEIGVEVGKGKVPVYSMTPELHDIDLMLEFARNAAEANVDVIQLFQLMGGHDMVPTREEQARYWRKVLTAIDHPVALSLHTMAGYLAPVDLVGDLCREFPHIRIVFTHGSSSKYLVELTEVTPAEVPVGTHLGREMQDLALGATIFSSQWANLIPRTCRQVIDGHSAGDITKSVTAVRRIQRLKDAVEPWGRPNSRLLKMSFRVLGLPGGKGGVREPLVLPAESELERIGSALERLGVREWEGWPAASY